MSSIEPRSRARRPVHGVLLLDKPVGITSNAALQAAKRLFCAAKAGHTGTLDPLASGLLPVCFGEATKFGSTLLDADKRYVARLQLGVRTTTGDAEGETVSVRPVAVDAASLDQALACFLGELWQVPPMHSALKHAGRALYAYARAGQSVERPARRVHVHSLAWRDLRGEELTLEIACSKGTYVRTLAEDLGEALGCGAHVIALRRTGIGELDLAAAVTLGELERQSPEERCRRLLPADRLLAALPAVRLSSDAAAALSHGMEIATPDLRDGLCRAYGPGDRFLGLAEASGNGRLRARRLIAGAASASEATLGPGANC